ncbi:hypothetical protein R1sor_007691 [Riccia sorocarpa]|uniref:F-box domain-containing protein n=1 Tax=Riccia sorocarpa TaxID=122646 RepID=A0ABD3HVC6_9MARC
MSVVFGALAPEPWGREPCYREEWFGGGYANVSKEQRDRVTRAQFVKDSALGFAGAATLGKREHDDKNELTGEKRRQAEIRVGVGNGYGQLISEAIEERGVEVGTFGDFRSCRGVLNMDLMTEGFKDEAIVLEKFGRYPGDLMNERAVLDWGGSKSLWEEALEACLQSMESPSLKPGIGNDGEDEYGSFLHLCVQAADSPLSGPGIDYYRGDEHGSLVDPRREQVTNFSSSSSDPVIGRLLGRAASSYIKDVLAGCNLGGVWSDSQYVQPGSSFTENMLREVRGTKLWEQDGNLPVDQKVCAERSAQVDNVKNEGPPEGFLFALSHLDLRSLFTLERVSKSLREAVVGDVLIWQHLNVGPPLNLSITDDVLVKLARRAGGHLKSLTLVGCLRITAAGLERVLSFSPELEKLCIPRCTGVKAEALVRMVEAHAIASRSRGLPGIRLLRIKGVYNITRPQLDVLVNVLQHGRDQEVDKLYRPYYYRHGNYCLTQLASDDERPIDLEPCPKCGNARVVYDCTRERCKQEKSHPGLTCRGCTLCIARCEECGTCIDDLSYEETFFLDLLCSSCWYSLPKCSDCNKPGCSRHPDDFRSAGSTFTCEDCRAGTSGPEFHIPEGL